jgi:hypothetical protein
MTYQSATDVTIDTERKLYVLKHAGGYVSCYGFDNCEKKIQKLRAWIESTIQYEPVFSPTPTNEQPVGTVGRYRQYEQLLYTAEQICRERSIRCDIDLTPQLIGLEGKRVEVVDCYGKKRRFYVGKSMGWMPCHLEISRHNDISGGCVTGGPFALVRVVGGKRK